MKSLAKVRCLDYLFANHVELVLVMVEGILVLTVNVPFELKTVLLILHALPAAPCGPSVGLVRQLHPVATWRPNHIVCSI